MRTINEWNKRPATILAYALIPLSGFAMDIYIPSLPDMAAKLNTTPTAIQYTLSLFLISLGIGQLFIGSVLDSFGRYRPGLLGLALFSIASFVICFTDSINMIYTMRVLQGISVATIVVSKRALFADLYTGEALRRCTSLFSVMGAAAPVVAPFIGGLLQVRFGWRANFFVVGLLGMMFLVFEGCYGGESLKARQPFTLPAILTAYVTMLKAKDFLLGMIMLGVCYSIIMVYAMTGPFLIEEVLHDTPGVTGNVSLVSGLAIMLGGIGSRRLIGRPYYKKVLGCLLLMELTALIVTGIASRMTSIYTVLAFVTLLHLGVGFLFNAVFSYVLTRFTNMSGKSGGLTGGVYIISTAVISQLMVTVFHIRTAVGWGLVNAGLVFILMAVFVTTKWRHP